MYEILISDINKKFGAGSAYLLGSNDYQGIPVIPTGSFRLDQALGVGGLPLGRMVEIYGPESSGKTTLCQHVMANAQKLGLGVAFVDVEHAMDPYWAGVCGLDIDNLIVSQPDSAEQSLEIVQMYIRSKEISVVVVDSVAALVPRAEIEGEMGDAHMALTARLMAQALRKLASQVKDNEVLLIFTNQLRQKIGVTWGSPETTTGGEALKYYASVRIDIRRRQQIKSGDEVIGNEVAVSIIKNKVAPPYKKCMMDIYYNEGISFVSELIYFGIDLGHVEKGGAWYTIGDEKIQGMNSLRSKLLEDKPFMVNLENNIRESLGFPLRKELRDGL